MIKVQENIDEKTNLEDYIDKEIYVRSKNMHFNNGDYTLKKITIQGLLLEKKIEHQMFVKIDDGGKRITKPIYQPKLYHINWNEISELTL